MRELIIFMLGACCGVSLLCLSLTIKEFHDNACELFGHKLPSTNSCSSEDINSIRAEIFDGGFNVKYVRLWSECKRCGKKAYYPRMYLVAPLPKEDDT